VKRRRLGAIVLLGLAVVLIAVLWRRRTAAPSRAKPPSDAPSLEVSRLREATARQREAVRGIAARFPRAAPATGARPRSILTKLVSNYCFIGPRDLCDTLLEPAGACADGDASACLAVGQYIADTPPRSTVARLFFRKGCELGDAAACQRIKELADGEIVDCAADVLRCAIQARRDEDPVRSHEACELGVADACDFMMREAAIGGDRAQVRAYLAKGCQLGSPMLCEMLGSRLAPGCKGDCLPPDPEQSAAALAFACESGHTEACGSSAPPAASGSR
jgi:hypothetical protein